MNAGWREAMSHGMPATGLGVLAHHIAFVRSLAQDERFRGPMCVIWISDFGGSLHMPVITFFLLGLGATTMDIGIFGFCRMAGAMMLSPVYGHCVDRFGIKWPLLICTSLCGIGCTVRGVAGSRWQLYLAQGIVGMGGGSSWSMVKGHIARHTSEEERPMVVAGLRLQMVVLSLSKVFYPVLDAILLNVFLLTDDLSRYRVAILTCMVFCWIGIAAIGLMPPPRSEHDDVLVEFRGSDFAARIPKWCSARLALLATVLAVASCCVATCTILWPIFLKHRFNWSAKEYAWASSVDTLCLASALWFYPRAVRLLGGERVGGSRLACVLTIFVVCALLIAFCLIPALVPAYTSRNAVLLHVLTALLASSSLGVLVPCLETLVSLKVPPAGQGGAMGAINAVASFGGLAGSLSGTALWTVSVRDGTWPIVSDGKLPFLVMAFMLLMCLLVLLRVQPHDEYLWAEDEIQIREIEPHKVGCSEEIGTHS